ncbi:MAG: hypothetical protein R6X14_02135 [bacterium]
MKTVLRIALLSAVLLAGCSRGPKHAFTSWVAAIRAGDAATVSRFDRDLANRLAGLQPAELEGFYADLAGHLQRPAATAFLETGFGVEPSAYHRKLYFPADGKVKVNSEELQGPDGARLVVEISYPRHVAPVYVTDIQVVWHGPATATPGNPAPPDRPVPVFSSGYFEAGHPFLENPGYRGYELRLQSGAVRTATLKVELARDPERGWMIADLTPLVAENVYWD